MALTFGLLGAISVGLGVYLYQSSTEDQKEGSAKPVCICIRHYIQIDANTRRLYEDDENTERIIGIMCISIDSIQFCLHTPLSLAP